MLASFPDDLCERWMAEPWSDPYTGAPISQKQQAVWKQYCDNLQLQPAPTETECRQWLSRPNYDPRMGSVLTPPSFRYQQWERACQSIGQLHPPIQALQVKPPPVELKNRHVEIKDEPCPLLDEIMATPVQGILTQEQYDDFSRRRSIFIRHFLRSHGACYLGDINFGLNVDLTDGVYLYQHIDWDECEGKRWVIADLGWESAPIDYRNPNWEQLEKVARQQNLVSGHAMMLIFDLAERTVELFEPNGPRAPWVPTIVRLLNAYFNELPEFIGFRLIQPWEDQYCPRSGLQDVSDDEMCANWSLLYVALRIACPEILRANLVEMLRSKGKAYLNTLMAHWDAYMRKYLEEVGYYRAGEAIKRIESMMRDGSLDDVPNQLYNRVSNFLHEMRSDYDLGNYAEVLITADAIDFLLNFRKPATQPIGRFMATPSWTFGEVSTLSEPMDASQGSFNPPSQEWSFTNLPNVRPWGPGGL